MARLKVLIVDDHEVVRVGLTSLIGRHEGFEVVAQAATGTEAVEQAIRHQPDLVVLDVLLPDKSGIEACREIRAACPNSRVLMLTSHANDEAVFQAIMAGASGYILKQVGSNPLIDALKAVAGGASLLDPAVTTQVLDRMRQMARRSNPSQDLLNEQERKILSLIAEGKTNREIAHEIYLGERTVRNYVSNILSKLNLANRSQAAAYAVQSNLCHPRSDRQ